MRAALQKRLSDRLAEAGGAGTLKTIKPVEGPIGAHARMAGAGDDVRRGPDIWREALRRPGRRESDGRGFGNRNAYSPPSLRGPKDHGNPGDTAENAGRRCADRKAFPLGHETAFWLKFQKPLPIGQELVPAGILTEMKAEGQIAGGHGSNMNHGSLKAIG